MKIKSTLSSSKETHQQLMHQKELIKKEMINSKFVRNKFIKYKTNQKLILQLVRASIETKFIKI
jgi:hypothetical protein